MFDQKKYASFSATDGARAFLKYGLFVLSTLSALSSKGLQYYVLGKEVMDVSSFSSFASLSDLSPLHKVEPFLLKLLKVFH